MRRSTVVIADRCPLVLLALRKVLAAHHDFKIVASCADGLSCMQAIRDFAPDIAILGLSMPDVVALGIFAVVNSIATRLVFFTESPEEHGLDRLAGAGACSIVPRDAEPEFLVQTLRRVLSGRRSLPASSFEEAKGQNDTVRKSVTALTDRERQIVHLVAKGMSNKEIGRRLNISNGTIKVHLHHIFEKLQINNRTTLAALAISQSDNAHGPLNQVRGSGPNS
jgi:two-component system nitrate/nitrite response regulator NarL